MVQRSGEITCIEDPISQALIPIEQFHEIYKPILVELNGDGGYPDTFISFFFQRDEVSSGALRFIGEDEKADWMDWAVELGIELTMKEIREGETAENKATRQAPATSSTTATTAEGTPIISASATPEVPRQAGGGGGSGGGGGGSGGGGGGERRGGGGGGGGAKRGGSGCGNLKGSGGGVPPLPGAAAAAAP